MQSVIAYRDLTNGPVEKCRDLCNQLMAYQVKMGQHDTDILKSMNFENRLKHDFETTKRKALFVAFDGEKPIGYIFLTAEKLTQKAKNARPKWAQRFAADSQGFFPVWLTTPAKIGTLDNLYVLPEYRGYHVGSYLTEFGMNWLREQSKADYLFVYVSNGNNAGPLYEKLGFQKSHPVFDGFIEAYYQKN